MHQKTAQHLADISVDAAPAGRREQKKIDMRDRIAMTTLKLVADHGLRNVTVEDISSAAGISRRTFHNYFSCKEDALAHNPGEGTMRLTALLRERPADESATDALINAIGKMVESEASLQSWQSREWLAHQHPELAFRYLVQIAEIEEQLVAEISPRLKHMPSPDLAARALVSTILSITRIHAMAATVRHDPAYIRELVEGTVAGLARMLTQREPALA